MTVQFERVTFTLHSPVANLRYMINFLRQFWLQSKQRRGILRSLGSPPPSPTGFIRTGSGSHAHSYPSAMLILPLPLFHGVVNLLCFWRFSFPCRMSFCMSILHVHAACPCLMFLLHVFAACPCYMSVHLWNLQINIHTPNPSSPMNPSKVICRRKHARQPWIALMNPMKTT